MFVPLLLAGIRIGVTAVAAIVTVKTVSSVVDNTLGRLPIIGKLCDQVGLTWPSRVAGVERVNISYYNKENRATRKKMKKVGEKTTA